MTQANPIEPAASSPGRQWIALLAVWATGVALLHLGVLAIGIKLEDIFRDFKVSLPALTQWLLMFARLYKDPQNALTMLWIWGGLLVTVAIVGQALRRGAYRLTVLLSLLFWLALVVAMVVAMLLPMIALLGAISGPGKPR